MPGEQMDSIQSHFKPASEGDAPKNIIVIGKGRIFSVNFYCNDGSIMSHSQILAILTEIANIVDRSDVEVPIPVLTCDDRSSWAAVRMEAREIFVRYFSFYLPESQTSDRTLTKKCQTYDHD